MTNPSYALGPCTINTFAQVNFTVTDAIGRTVTHNAGVNCTKLAP